MRNALKRTVGVPPARAGAAAALFAPLVLAALLLAAWGCASVPEVIDDDLSPAEFFQRAQEASDVGRYAVARRYYEVFLARFPDELERRLWAKYEIAFLHHKMGNSRVAVEGFEALLEEYAAAPADLPQGPRILAEKVKARIEEQLSP